MELKRNGSYKLTMDQVEQIRQLYGEGFTQGSIARHFGVSAGQIGRIVRGESRRDAAVAREATPQELDAAAARLLELQRKVNAEQALNEGLPPAKKVERIDPFAPGGVYGPKAASVPPPDPLDELGDA